MAVSGQTGEGLDALRQVIEKRHEAFEASGALTALRSQQQLSWLWSLINERLERLFRNRPAACAS